MGSVFKRGNRWYYCFKDQSGRWIKKVGGATREEADALLKVAETCQHLAPEARNTPLAPLVTAYLQKLSVYAKRRSREGAAASCRLLLNHFAKAPLNQSGLDAFVAARAKGVKPKSVNNDLIILRAVINYALESSSLDKAPFRIRLLKTNRKRHITLLSAEEVKRLLDCSKGNTHGVLLLSAATGMRLGETLHLQWKDVSVEEGAIHVSPKGEWSPKNYRARTLYVPDVVLSYLRERREFAKWNGESDWIFPSSREKPIQETSVSHMIKKVFIRAGLYRPGESTTHRLRHVVASRLLSNGVSIETTRAWLGHASITTTALYIHRTEEEKQRAARKIDLLL